MKIGILVHGRHVEAQGWEHLMWGQPPHQIGLLPRLVQVILEYGLDNIHTIFIGSGVQAPDGRYESEHIYEYLVEHFDSIDSFDFTQDTVCQSIERDSWKDMLLGKIDLDTTSQNTREEIINADQSFQDCTQVLQITSCSHSPRCSKHMSELVAEGVLSSDKIRMVIPDMTPYLNTTPADVFIAEPPHRGDDAFVEEDIQPHTIFQKFFTLKNHEARLQVLRDLEESLKKNS